jgi:signal peptidase II
MWALRRRFRISAKEGICLMFKKPRFPTMLMIAGVVVALDHISKMWFLDHYKVGESHRITSFLYFTLVHNTGTAFGMFQNSNKPLLILSYGILIGLLYSARGLCEKGGMWAFWGVSLLIGGAIGNIIDRHTIGHVIDFLDFRIWPVFNIADSAITVGAISSAIGMFLYKDEQKYPASRLEA